MKSLRLKIPVSFFREGKRIVAYSPALDVSTSGKTYAETERRFAELVRILFEELDDLGTTGEVLESLGWQKVRKEWTAPAPIAHRIEDIYVPVPQT